MKSANATTTSRLQVLLDAAGRLAGDQRTLFQSLYVQGTSIEQAGQALGADVTKARQLRSEMLRSLMRAAA